MRCMHYALVLSKQTRFTRASIASRGYYPRDAMLARVIAIVTCLSVCPVCLSVCHELVLCHNEESNIS